MGALHIPLSWHVLDDSPFSCLPPRQEYRTVEPNVNLSPLSTPLGGEPGWPQSTTSDMEKEKSEAFWSLCKQKITVGALPFLVERFRLTYTLWQGFVPLSCWLAGQHRRSEQVESWVTVEENHGAEGEVPVLNFTLANGVGRDSWIRAVDHYTQGDTHRGTDTQRWRQSMCYLASTREGHFSPPFFTSEVFQPVKQMQIGECIWGQSGGWGI